MTAPLQLPFQVVLNGAGYGTVTIGPHGETWDIATLSTSVSTAANESTMNVYRGGLGVVYRVDFTNTASSGDISDTPYRLLDGETLTVEWVGGDPGATATVLVRGTSDRGVVGSGGFRAVP